MADRVSLAELLGAGFVLHSAEAAAIVTEVCRQHEGGRLRGIPSTHVIRLTRDGHVVAEGPITTDRPPIAKAAQLLDDLLPPFGAPPSYRVPGGLRLVLARALGTLDLPPFGSLDEFCAAVARFAAGDLTSTTRNLYRAWELMRTPSALTISDLRRARRATGLSLEDISSASGVSADRLRELEWGYLKHWRNDAVGRTWLCGYSKASGLDEQLVTSIVMPMLEEINPREPDRADDQEEVALVASGPQELVPAAAWVPAPVGRRRWAIVWTSAAVAALVLLAIVATIIWPRPTVQARMDSPPALVPASVVTEDHIVPAVQTHTIEKPRVTKARTPVKRASSAPARKPASKPNFFKRQLLRIVIK